MIKVDDRTPDQVERCHLAVVARDTFMSGWGRAENGHSRIAWAVEKGVNIERLEDWVDDREEMKYVNIVDLRKYRVPSGTAHFHIYVATPDHPSQD
tara:strand:- start:243 stop:530 length:288 start_codon:yes stop_codon:yes gene_type:complete